MQSGISGTRSERLIYHADAAIFSLQRAAPSFSRAQQPRGPARHPCHDPERADRAADDHPLAQCRLPRRCQRARGRALGGRGRVPGAAAPRRRGGRPGGRDLRAGRRARAAEDAVRGDAADAGARARPGALPRHPVRHDQAGARARRLAAARRARRAGGAAHGRGAGAAGRTRRRGGSQSRHHGQERTCQQRPELPGGGGGAAGAARAGDGGGEPRAAGAHLSSPCELDLPPC